MEHILPEEIMKNYPIGIFSETGDYILSNELFKKILKIDHKRKENFFNILGITTKSVVYSVKKNGFFAKYINEKNMLLFVIPSREKLITFLHSTHEDIYENRELFEVLVKKSPVGFFIYQESFVFANKTFEEITGYSLKELKRIKPFDIVHPKLKEQIKKTVNERLSGKKMEKHYQLLTIITKNSEKKHIELLTTTVKYRNKYSGAGICIDRTEKVKLEEKLNHLYLYDELTGLPNRRQFMNKLKDAIEYAKKNNHLIAVILIDLVEFKLVNKKFGYETGDMILKEVSNRLQKISGSSDTVSRVGDDKFGIIIYSFKSFEKLSEKIEQIINRLKKEYRHMEFEIFADFKAGISVFPKDGVYPDELFKNCEIALLKAKKTAGKTYEFFSESINEEIAKILQTKETIKRLIERNHVIIHFQPIVSLKDGSAFAFEALFRIDTQNGEIILPKNIIPVAEETGLIVELGDRIISSAVSSGKKLGKKISINISAVQLSKPDFDKNILQLVKKEDFDPEKIIIEITETSLMENITQNLSKLKNLRENGIGISIDDFGTGYSSMSYLKVLPLDFLKIDISFIRGIGKNKKDEMIVKTIISMAKSLNVKTIAEGVEKKEQVDFLKKHGCDYAQGFFFSRPLPPEKFVDENIDYRL